MAAFLKKYYLYFIITIIIGGGVILRLPKDDLAYKSGDATYHTLLTIKAYDENPISTHKFLPIVSLGGEDNKNISWGATVKDSKGNYYYTSFSAVGFVLPYLFIKLFFLPINEYSLYIFNSIVLIISLFLIIKLMIKLFDKYLSKKLIIVLSSLMYLFQIEIMHSQGVVYWVHSIMQVFLLLHFLMFLNYDKNKKYKILFYILCLILPYVEWTGFISNVAFMLLLVIKNYKKHKKICLKESVFVGCLTLISLLLFIGHFLMNIEFSVLFNALYKRFMARNVVSRFSFIKKLFKGYMISYGYLIILIGVLFITVLINRKYRQKFLKLLKEYVYAIIFFSFIILENFLLMEHSTVYSFDRLKVVFILMIILFILVITIIKQSKDRVFWERYIVICLIMIAIINSYNYLFKVNGYIYKFNYTLNNNLIVKYIKDNYNEENSILSSPFLVRGYINLLFDRGIYEQTPYKSSKYNNLKNIAFEKNKQYLINIDYKNTEKAQITKVYISDLKNIKEYKLEIKDENVVLIEV